ncbi:MAG: PepSY-associated TM helix domain-containing protein [Hydrogenophaga sp.]|uniref:PepSY-associated TM helix domain-containing protein n=1 Tax=Hydrogenophaga sp. TaxID=1904254 RepID=UPI003D0C76AA
MAVVERAPTPDAGTGLSFSTSRFHAAAWRWHFYAGLYVVPFLLMLAITGAVMVFFTGFQTRLGPLVHVTPQAATLPVSVQAQAVMELRSQGALLEYMAPRAADQASWFTVARDGLTEAVAVDPYTARVLHLVNKEDTVFAWAQRIHGTLLIGDVGDRLIEIAAGFGVMMIVTGLYLWWPRGGTRWGQVLVPDLRLKGRLWWRSLHGSVGFWIGAVLLTFLLTGLSWSGIWGGKIVQPWGSFPAEKWGEALKSDATHASLNPKGQHEVPWGLEQTPLPASGSASAAVDVPSGQPVNVDAVVVLAKQLGFEGQYHVQWPQSESGVFTISADTMSGDLGNPTRDRTVHVDRYSGRVLAEVGFADYSMLAKGMAVGIALHQGDLGWWNAVLNLLFCAGVAFLCVSGMVMWWKRRPAGSGWRIVAPPVPRDLPFWKGGAVVMGAVALAFPLSGAVLAALLLLDWLVVSRLPVRVAS